MFDRPFGGYDGESYCLINRKAEGYPRPKRARLLSLHAGSLLLRGVGVSEGTPLRKYGKYRVRQIKRRTPYFELEDETCDDLGKAIVARSYCKEAVEFVGERLGSGRMLATPREYMESVVSQFARGHRSRFSHALQAWFVGSVGSLWINGGPVSDCNTDGYSRAGIAWRKAKVDSERQRMLAACGEDVEWRNVNQKKYDDCDARDASIFRRFMAGDWPEVMGDEHRMLDGGYGESFETMIAAEVSPEWVDAGRAAMRVLLKHGTDGDYPMRDKLEWLARQLEERFGGSWLP